MNYLFFPFAGLSFAALLLILQGCVSAEHPRDQPPAARAARERSEGIATDQPKVAKPPAREDDLIRAILTAPNPSEAAAGYSALFKLVGNDGLSRLQMHASDTIAIQAAWMQVELTVPVKEPAQVVRPDREKLAWFLGFLEGRARVSPPKWWAEALLDARANRRGNIYAGGLNTSLDRALVLNNLQHAGGLNNLWLDPKTGKPIFETWPTKATIEQKKGKLVVKLGKEFASLPDDFLKKVKKQEGLDYDVRALFTLTRCYLAMHDSVGYSYRIGCIDRSPLKVRWVSEVWGSWWGASTGGGPGQHWVEIVKQGNRILVFGIAGCGFHVEAFRADNGANLFRFSNSYTP